MKASAHFIVSGLPFAIVGGLLGRAGLSPLEHAEWWFWMVPIAVSVLLRDVLEGGK